MKSNETFASRQQYIQPFSSQLSGSARVLILGVSDVLDFEVMNRAGFRIDVVDPDGKLAQEELAQGVGYSKRDLRMISFPKDCFQGVWIDRTLSSFPVEEVQRVLALVHQAMVPNGVLGWVLFEGEGFRDEMPGGISGPVVRRYLLNENPVCSLLEQTGFKEVKVGRFAGLMMLLAKRI